MHERRKKVALAVVTDLWKAFDILDHEILLSQLDSYAIRIELWHKKVCLPVACGLSIKSITSNVYQSDHLKSTYRQVWGPSKIPVLYYFLFILMISHLLSQIPTSLCMLMTVLQSTQPAQVIRAFK